MVMGISQKIDLGQRTKMPNKIVVINSVIHILSEM